MAQQLTFVSMSNVIPGNNDRTHFDPIKLQELADTIRENGLRNPVTLRPVGEKFEIVAGERRFRACQLLEWELIPALIDDLTDEQAAAIMLTENIARQDLDPIDEANAFQHRIAQLGWSVEETAQKAGISTVYVHFRLKLLRLRPDLQHLIRHGNLQLGYAQILADADLDTNRQMLALKALRDNASPTPVWFRSEVNRLAQAQRQESLFADEPLLKVQVVSTQTSAAADPPIPGKVNPPTDGDTPRAVLDGQIKFWSRAADQWQALGKSFKRNECLAAVAALTALSSVLG